jgi:hypothetical protein
MNNECNFNLGPCSCGAWHIEAEVYLSDISWADLILLQNNIEQFVNLGPEEFYKWQNKISANANPVVS